MIDGDGQFSRPYNHENFQLPFLNQSPLVGVVTKRRRHAGQFPRHRAAQLIACLQKTLIIHDMFFRLFLGIHSGDSSVSEEEDDNDDDDDDDDDVNYISSRTSSLPRILQQLMGQGNHVVAFK